MKTPNQYQSNSVTVNYLHGVKFIGCAYVTTTIFLAVRYTILATSDCTVLGIVHT